MAERGFDGRTPLCRAGVAPRGAGAVANRSERKPAELLDVRDRAGPGAEAVAGIDVRTDLAIRDRTRSGTGPHEIQACRRIWLHIGSNLSRSIVAEATSVIAARLANTCSCMLIAFVA